MYSRAHAAVGAVVSAALVALTGSDAALASSLPLWPAVLWAYGVALSVGIDADHFLIARATRGDWRPLRRVLSNPRLAVGDQDAIFDDDDVTEAQRLLSHALLGAGLVGALWPWAPVLAAYTAGVLYAHVVADLAWDVWREAAGPGA